MTQRIWTYWTKGWALMLLLPGAAAAQPSDALEAMDLQVKSGQHVVITEFDGHRVKGRVTTVGESALTLLVVDGFDERPVTLDASTVATIRRNDSLLNGFLIGLGSGLVGGEVWIYGMCGPPGYDAECRGIATPIGWAVFGGGGAAIGTLIDKFSTKLLYRAPLHASHLCGTRFGARALHLQPLLGSDMQGLRVSLTF